MLKLSYTTTFTLFAIKSDMCMLQIFFSSFLLEAAYNAFIFCTFVPLFDLW